MQVQEVYDSVVVVFWVLPVKFLVVVFVASVVGVVIRLYCSLLIRWFSRSFVFSRSFFVCFTILWSNAGGIAPFPVRVV